MFPVLWYLECMFHIIIIEIIHSIKVQNRRKEKIRKKTEESTKLEDRRMHTNKG